MAATLRSHVTITDCCYAELQQPPVVPIVYVRRAVLARDANHRQPPHVREEDVLDKVEREYEHGRILVGHGAQDVPGVYGAGAGVKSDGAASHMTATERTRQTTGRTCPCAS